MQNPPYRYSTKKALEELAIELNLRARIPYWDAMAGYSYTPGNPEDIQEYLEYYIQLKDEDKKFTLMEMILDALAEQSIDSDIFRYWQKIKPILIQDYSIHEYTVYYWSEITDMDFDSSNIIKPLILEIMKNKA